MLNPIGAVPLLLFALLQTNSAPDAPVQLDFTMTVEVLRDPGAPPAANGTARRERPPESRSRGLVLGTDRLVVEEAGRRGILDFRERRRKVVDLGTR
jgi:hypothetical protein